MAVRNYTKAISRDALRPDIRIRKARLLSEINRIPEALQTLDETILTNPDVFEGYHLKFLILLQARRLDEAEEVVAQGLEMFPKDPGFVLDRVTLLIEKNKIDEAFALLDELENHKTADDSIRRRICMERAQIHATRNDVEAAILELERANGLGIADSEFDSEVVFLLANCYLTVKMYDKLLDCSIPLFEKSSDDYIKQTARYYRPFSLKMLGRTDEALPLYTEAINEYRNLSLASPGNLDAYLLRVMCLRDIEQYDKALELIDYVLALKPEQPEPRMLRITLLESLGRQEEAQKETVIVNEMLPKELRRTQDEVIR
jgi:tetratricopeptide (TPR) repeat protein